MKQTNIYDFVARGREASYTELTKKSMQIKKGSLKQLLESLKSDLGCDEGKLIASHPMTEEQKELYAITDKLSDKLIEVKKELEVARKKMWNKIEGDLEIFDKNLKINTTDSTIEVYESDCENCDKE